MGKSLGIWLLTLAVVTLFSASEVDSIKLLCCMGGNPEEVHNIKKCFEQVRRVDCNYHAFLIITNSGNTRCVEPGSPWLKELINTGKLQCPHVIQAKRRFEVLDDVDME
ncbi:uncharacterized protein LOC122972445 isoform X1 [Scomber scombrus]|uniref:Uncharacterized protein LOC122972445 isoform X1 n=1 Tax=Scomber scombrus TaxID=13677 RepID=A0AAV1PBV9_SCOSC